MPTKTDEYQAAPRGRILRKGDVVQVTGLRGRWKIKGFLVREDETIEVTVFGGPKGHFRTVTADRIGTRKAMA